MAQRIAIVVPRCAPMAYGGAETFALRLAQELRERFEAEVLTTCAVDYWTWENALPPGREDFEGVPVVRFKVDAPRNLREFDRLSRSFRYRIGSLSIAEQEAWIKAQGPYSTPLWQHLFEHRTDYDAFVFLPYLYATTYFGLPIVRERSVLVPLAHDEWPLYFPSWDRLFGYARAFAFVTPEERELLRRRFPQETLAGDVLHPRLVPGGDVMVRHAHHDTTSDKVMLYVGRIDESKGVHQLIEFFLEHCARRPDSPWRLELAGPPDAHRALPTHERIAYAGELPPAKKAQLLQSCALLVVPGMHESLSIVLLEGWAQGRPALVNGHNPVLVGQARRANGALWYEDAQSFDAALQTLDEPTLAALGAQGHAFVTRTYTRGNAVDVFERVLATLRVPA